MKLTPLEIRQSQAMALAINLISAQAITNLIEHDQRIDEAVEKRNRLEEEGLLFDPLPSNLLVQQLEAEREQIKELFLAAGTFHEDKGISA